MMGKGPQDRGRQGPRPGGPGYSRRDRVAQLGELEVGRRLQTVPVRRGRSGSELSGCDSRIAVQARGTPGSNPGRTSSYGWELGAPLEQLGSVHVRLPGDPRRQDRRRFGGASAPLLRRFGNSCAGPSALAKGRVITIQARPDPPWPPAPPRTHPSPARAARRPGHPPASAPPAPLAVPRPRGRGSYSPEQQACRSRRASRSQGRGRRPCRGSGRQGRHRRPPRDRRRHDPRVPFHRGNAHCTGGAGHGLGRRGAGRGRSGISDVGHVAAQVDSQPKPGKDDFSATGPVAAPS